MIVALLDRLGERDRSVFNRRSVALFLTLAIHALVLLLLLLVHDRIEPRKEDRPLSTFDIAPGEKKKDEEKKSGDQQAKKADKKASKVQPEVKPHIAPPVEVPDQPAAPSFITMTHDQFAASDIAGMTSQKSGEDTAGAGDSKAISGPGQGPGGAHLYNAEWYRKPTNPELATYLPANGPREGWGLVACRTIEDYHVENCQSLGESPLGSGFARAIRQAAWQFQIVPPRMNGKPMIGAWVRIRITYGLEGPSAASGPG